jgi:uncharacterized protein YecT (DUF1311 family)
MVAEKCRTPADRGDCVEAEDDLEKVEEREKVEEEQVVLLLAQRGALLVRDRPREAVRSAPRATMEDMMMDVCVLFMMDSRMQVPQRRRKTRSRSGRELF